MKRRWWLIALATVMVLLVGWRILGGRSRAADGGAALTYSPVQAARGPISIAIDATGKVAPAENVNLAPAGEGRITAVLVSEGDLVHKGQVLVRLDLTDAEAHLRQAEDALKVAEAKLRTVLGNAALSPAQARMQVDRARAAVASAKSRLDLLRSGPSADEITQAKANVNQAQLALESAQSDYERMQRLYAEHAVTKQQLDAAQNKYLSANESLIAAKARLNQLTAPAKAEDLAAAEASLAQAQADLAIAEENLRTAGLEEQVAAARADERKARDALATARQDAAGMVLVAPFAGLVTEVKAKVGAYATMETPLISIADPVNLIVEAEVDENDIALTQPGQKARITLDAIPDLELDGEVLTVGGLGKELNGVVVFAIKVSLADPAHRVKIGMNADVTIVIDSRDDVVNVPNAAIETRMGRPAVRLYLPDGTTQYRRVRIGLRTDTVTEIVEGLREGERVAVPAVKSSAETSRSPQERGRMMPFGGAVRIRR
ncbi:MAG: efflux RND transporter periplasmic adaptor subunit [Bacteroidota bacterium]